MASNAELIENEALSLPSDERVTLVVHLLDSLDERPVSDPETIEHAWLDEAKRRLSAYRNGETESIAAEAVFTELRADDD